MRRTTVSALVACLALAGCAQQSVPSNNFHANGDANPSSSSTLFVGNTHTVTTYATKSGVLEKTISKDVLRAVSMQFDAGGDLVVANSGQSISVYAAGTFDHVQTFKTPRPKQILLDGRGNLYVLSTGAVNVYQPGQSAPYDTTPIRTITSGLRYAQAFALDSQGTLYVANYARAEKGGSTITIYSANSDLPSQTITQGVNQPYSLALDASGKLAVGNFGNQSVTVYAASTFSLVASITSGMHGPTCLTFDRAANLYVCNGASEITAYSAGSFSLIRTIVQGIGAPRALLLDTKGNLFVANQAGNSVTEYAPSSYSPKMTFAQGVQFPYSLALQYKNR